MKKREACFACTTPYQVMGAISITQALKLDADLFIFGMFDKYDRLAENLKKHHIFHHIIPVDCKRYRLPDGKLKSRVIAFGQITFAERVVSEFLPRGLCYGSFYSSSRAHIKTVLYHVLMKRNPMMKRVIYDDGLGTYNKESHVLNTSGLRMKAEKFLGWDKKDSNNVTFMPYVPELFEAPDNLSECPVIPMPRIDWTEQNKTMLLDVFQVDQSTLDIRKVMIFDDLREIDESKKEKEATLDKCYEMIVSILGKENVINKPHPRSITTSKANVAIFGATNCPMEVIYARINNLSEKVLITYASTAVLTPRIMFGVEPVTIFLFRIIEGDKGSNSVLEGIYCKFKDIYKEQSRIFAPKTLKELEKILLGLKDYKE